MAWMRNRIGALLISHRAYYEMLSGSLPGMTLSCESRKTGNPEQARDGQGCDHITRWHSH